MFSDHSKIKLQTNKEKKKRSTEFIYIQKLNKKFVTPLLKEKVTMEVDNTFYINRKQYITNQNKEYH